MEADMCTIGLTSGGKKAANVAGHDNLGAEADVRMDPCPSAVGVTKAQPEKPGEAVAATDKGQARQRRGR